MFVPSICGWMVPGGGVLDVADEVGDVTMEHVAQKILEEIVLENKHTLLV